ncbi:Ankyrin repeat domain-containing protein (plasmid) [Candidatus Trichorickettsia mobilis]|uniref:Ankyrin repeat domain-containing protein n=1 Tax=Candidatus Trichorickettsia mobilis TaxID=1346319 RepID=A0ABZ0UTX2_9RICK|nr:ankyrin repeat domain-containing protein [Candidatus Trichorickettsia mobilis]WPY01485.1 Ankyrin repeat domain-containing protein [Candidatus Trichorickettsia mobilis]
MKPQDFIKMIDESKLLDLVNNNDLERIAYLVENGLDVNKPSKYFETMLSRAVKTNATDIATYLIKKGADVNMPVVERESQAFCSCNKYSLLSKVAYHDKSGSIFAELLRAYPDLDIHEIDFRSNSILDYAIRGRNKTMVDVLVGLGAKTNSESLECFNKNNIDEGNNE